MPTINPSLVPTITPGGVFSEFTTNDSLNIRWLTSVDPVYFEVFNRPMADIVLRQLILAKAIDALELSLGHQTLYPFLVQPQVSSGGTTVDVPLNWIWDIQMSLPKKWQDLRLAKIKRMSGENGDTGGDYTGILRLIFTATQIASSTEVAIFSADYEIDSNLTYQRSRLTVVDSDEESVAISVGETETVAGFIEFRLLDTSEAIVQSFLDLVEPPTDTTDANGDGLYDNPAVYELIDTVAGGANVTDDFATAAINHGTGILTHSAWNAIPPLDSDVQSWVESFNYPFDADASLTSADNISIPTGIFREFDICVPAGDEPTGSTTGLYFPVWISRIEKNGTGNLLTFYFATHNVTDTESDGSPSTEAVEFATLELSRTSAAGDIIAIIPSDDLMLKETSDTEWHQHFGRGHVVLSSLWDGTSSVVDDFFDAFDSIVDDPADTEFTQSSTRISSFGLSRVPKYVPTIGQSRALFGSTSRRTVPVDPSYDNRYVTELDQGQGNQVDLEDEDGINPHNAVDRYGYSGSLCHKIIKLVIDGTQVGSDSAFYDEEILPRLRILLGRDPAFGDYWYDGTRLKFFNGDLWQA